MSYDLFFCREKRANKPVNFDAAAQWLLTQEHCKREHESQVWYNNEATGVYFVFEENSWEDPEESPVPPEYQDVGVSFNLNFNRPSFFGHEAMPFVQRFAEQFGVIAMDGEEQPIALTSELLIARWSKSNDWAVKALRKEEDMEPAYSMPRAKSLAWWRYMQRHSVLEKELENDDIFVPRLELIHNPETREVMTYTTWAPGIAMIIPSCDYFGVIRERQRLLRPPKQELGFVPAAKLWELTHEFLESYDTERGLLTLRGSNVERVGQVLLGLDLPNNVKQFGKIAPDSFVDRESLE